MTSRSNERSELPFDAEGTTINVGDVLVSGAGRVYRFKSWAYATGESCRAELLVRRRGQWVVGKPNELYLLMTCLKVTEEQLNALTDQDSVRRYSWERSKGLSSERHKAEIRERKDHMRMLRENFIKEGSPEG